jgi:rhodanese-related sulfurtransferase
MNWQQLLGRPAVEEIDVAEAKRRHGAGAVLIDVREPDEWAAGHVAGARLIPLGQLRRQLGKLPRDREVLFICRSGNRSGTATLAARRAGLGRALNIRGGMIAWAQAGLPIER